jgi:hypothetical protein
MRFTSDISYFITAHTKRGKRRIMKATGMQKTNV